MQSKRYLQFGLLSAALSTSVHATLIQVDDLTKPIYGTKQVELFTSFQAYEWIYDRKTKAAGESDNAVDLERVRFVGSGDPVTEISRSTTTSDGDIKDNDENDVDGNFGKFNAADVTFSHQLTWLDLGSRNLSATLTIGAYKVDGSNDKVNADSTFLGNLTAGSSNTFSNFSVATSYFAADRKLVVQIDKSPGDTIELFSSKLVLSWDVIAYETVIDYTRVVGYEQKWIEGGAGQRIPEGGDTVILLGAAGVGICLLRRRRAGGASRR